MKIGRLALKTAFATMTIFFSLFLFIFNINVLFMPSKAADLFDLVGNAQLSISLSRVTSDRNNDINDMSTLIERAIKYKDYNTLITYIPKLESYSYYQDFANYKDGQNLNEFSDYKSFIDGNYLIALYSKNSYDNCIDLCKNHLKSGYSDSNPVRFLVRLLSSLNTNFEILEELLIEKYNDETLSVSDKKNICVDLYSIYLGVNNSTKSNLWKNNFNSLNN